MSKNEFESKFKAGDILMLNDWIIIIYAGLTDINIGGRIWHCLEAYAALYEGDEEPYIIIGESHPFNGIGNIDGFNGDNIRLTINYEKERIYKAIRKENFNWNPRTLMFEKIG